MLFLVTNNASESGNNTFPRQKKLPEVNSSSSKSIHDGTKKTDGSRRSNSESDLKSSQSGI